MSILTKTKYGGIFVKKFKIISYIILSIVLVVLALTAYTSASQNDENSEKEKATSEIRYLDTKLVDLFNNMNNIQTRNYQIYTSKIEESRSAENSGGGSSGEDSNSSSNTDSGSNSDSNSDSDSRTENTDENYEMQPSGILTTNRDIDWNSCKNESELIYTSISTITLDLYRLNVSQEDILNFNKDLDNLTVSLEEENKQLALDSLVKIYEYIPKFAQTIIDDTLYKTVLETKLNVFKGYAKLDGGDWEQINSNMIDAINVYATLLTNTEIDSTKQTSVNKGYVMLNELKNAIDTKNISVFLIKYKNLLEEINNL